MLSATHLRKQDRLTVSFGGGAARLPFFLAVFVELQQQLCCFRLQLSAYTASAVAPPVKRTVSLWACFSSAGCRNERLVNVTCAYSMLFTCFYSQLADPAALGIKHDSQLSNQSASASCLLKDIFPPATPWITQCGDSCCEALHR